MNFELGDEEHQLIDAARTALARTDTLSAARSALDGEPMPHLWDTAVKGGWADLPELLYAVLVLIECGRRLAPTGLAGHLAATAVLARGGDIPAALRDGTQRAAYVPMLEYVPDAPGADVLVLPDGSVSHAAVTPVGKYDPTRPLGNVALAELPSGDAYGWYVLQTLLAAEALGVAEASLEMAVAYAMQRHAFGRPIGSFQAIKHQLTDVLRRNENARSLLYYAGYAVSSAPAEFGLAANAARLAADDAADVGTRRCVAVHGGIGATWEHDAHLYFRRAQLGRLLLGGPDKASEEVVAHVL